MLSISEFAAPTFAAGNCFSAATSNCLLTVAVANSGGISCTTTPVNNFFYLDPYDSNLKSFNHLDELPWRQDYSLTDIIVSYS